MKKRSFWSRLFGDKKAESQDVPSDSIARKSQHTAANSLENGHNIANVQEGEDVWHIPDEYRDKRDIVLVSDYAKFPKVDIRAPSGLLVHEATPGESVQESSNNPDSRMETVPTQKATLSVDTNVPEFDRTALFIRTPDKKSPTILSSQLVSSEKKEKSFGASNVPAPKKWSMRKAVRVTAGPTSHGGVPGTGGKVKHDSQLESPVLDENGHSIPSIPGRAGTSGGVGAPNVLSHRVLSLLVHETEYSPEVLVLGGLGGRNSSWTGWQPGDYVVLRSLNQTSTTHPSTNQAFVRGKELNRHPSHPTMRTTQATATTPISSSTEGKSKETSIDFDKSTESSGTAGKDRDKSKDSDKDKEQSRSVGQDISPEELYKDERIRPKCLLLRLPDSDEATGSGTRNISSLMSVSETIAKAFGWAAGDPIEIRRLPGGRNQAETLFGVSHAEFTFRGQHVSRGGLWRYRQALGDSLLYVGQQIEARGMRMTVHELACPLAENTPNLLPSHSTAGLSASPVLSGIVLPVTRFSYRSRSSAFILLLDMSKELWNVRAGEVDSQDSENDVGTAVDLLTREFLPDLFRRWAEKGTSHSVTISLFGRTEFQCTLEDLLKNVGGPNEDMEKVKAFLSSRALTLDVDGRIYEDLYLPVAYELPLTAPSLGGQSSQLSVETKRLLSLIRRRIYEFPQKAKWGLSPEPYGDSPQAEKVQKWLRELSSPAPSQRGNLLEALNISLKHFSRHHIDRDLYRMGQNIIVVTAGTGAFEVDPKLAQVTKQGFLDLGIGCDIVSLAPPPCHNVPLFISRTVGYNLQDTISVPSALFSHTYAPPTSHNLPVLDATSHKLTYSVPHWIHCSFAVLCKEREKSKSLENKGKVSTGPSSPPLSPGSTPNDLGTAGLQEKKVHTGSLKKTRNYFLEAHDPRDNTGFDLNPLRHPRQHRYRAPPPWLLPSASFRLVPQGPPLFTPLLRLTLPKNANLDLDDLTAISFIAANRLKKLRKYILLALPDSVYRTTSLPIVKNQSLPSTPLALPLYTLENQTNRLNSSQEAQKDGQKQPSREPVINRSDDVDFSFVTLSISPSETLSLTIAATDKAPPHIPNALPLSYALVQKPQKLSSSEWKEAYAQYLLQQYPLPLGITLPLYNPQFKRHLWQTSDLPLPGVLLHHLSPHCTPLQPDHQFAPEALQSEHSGRASRTAQFLSYLITKNARALLGSEARHPPQSRQVQCLLQAMSQHDDNVFTRHRQYRSLSSEQSFYATNASTGLDYSRGSMNTMQFPVSSMDQLHTSGGGGGGTSASAADTSMPTLRGSHSDVWRKDALDTSPPLPSQLYSRLSQPSRPSQNQLNKNNSFKDLSQNWHSYSVENLASLDKKQAIFLRNSLQQSLQSGSFQSPTPRTAPNSFSIFPSVYVPKHSKVATLPYLSPQRDVTYHVFHSRYLPAQISVLSQSGAYHARGGGRRPKLRSADRDSYYDRDRERERDREKDRELGSARTGGYYHPSYASSIDNLGDSLDAGGPPSHSNRSFQPVRFRSSLPSLITYANHAQAGSQPSTPSASSERRHLRVSRTLDRTTGSGLAAAYSALQGAGGSQPLSARESDAGSGRNILRALRPDTFVPPHSFTPREDSDMEQSTTTPQGGKDESSLSLGGLPSVRSTISTPAGTFATPVSSAGGIMTGNPLTAPQIAPGSFFLATKPSGTKAPQQGMTEMSPLALEKKGETAANHEVSGSPQPSVLTRDNKEDKSSTHESPSLRTFRPHQQPSPLPQFTAAPHSVGWESGMGPSNGTNGGSGGGTAVALNQEDPLTLLPPPLAIPFVHLRLTALVAASYLKLGGDLILQSIDFQNQCTDHLLIAYCITFEPVLLLQLLQSDLAPLKKILPSPRSLHPSKGDALSNSSVLSGQSPSLTSSLFLADTRTLQDIGTRSTLSSSQFPTRTTLLSTINNTPDSTVSGPSNAVVAAQSATASHAPTVTTAAAPASFSGTPPFPVSASFSGYGPLLSSSTSASNTRASSSEETSATSTLPGSAPLSTQRALNTTLPAITTSSTPSGSGTTGSHLVPLSTSLPPTLRHLSVVQEDYCEADDEGDYPTRNQRTSMLRSFAHSVSSGDSSGLYLPPLQTSFPDSRSNSAPWSLSSGTGPQDQFSLGQAAGEAGETGETRIAASDRRDSDRLGLSESDEDPTATTTAAVGAPGHYNPSSISPISVTPLSEQSPQSIHSVPSSVHAVQSIHTTSTNATGNTVLSALRTSNRPQPSHSNGPISLLGAPFPIASSSAASGASTTGKSTSQRWSLPESSSMASSGKSAQFTTEYMSPPFLSSTASVLHSPQSYSQGCSALNQHKIHPQSLPQCLFKAAIYVWSHLFPFTHSLIQPHASSNPSAGLLMNPFHRRRGDIFIASANRRRWWHMFPSEHVAEQQFTTPVLRRAHIAKLSATASTSTGGDDLAAAGVLKPVVEASPSSFLLQKTGMGLAAGSALGTASRGNLTASTPNNFSPGLAATSAPGTGPFGALAGDDTTDSDVGSYPVYPTVRSKHSMRRRWIGLNNRNVQGESLDALLKTYTPYWVSLTEPAVLPLTTDFHPTPDILATQFTDSVYTVALPSAHQNIAWRRASVNESGFPVHPALSPSSLYQVHTQIVEELVAQRLLLDFQLVVEPTALDLEMPLVAISTLPEPAAPAYLDDSSDGGMEPSPLLRKDATEAVSGLPSVSSNLSNIPGVSGVQSIPGLQDSKGQYMATGTTGHTSGSSTKRRFILSLGHRIHVITWDILAGTVEVRQYTKHTQSTRSTHTIALQSDVPVGSRAWWLNVARGMDTSAFPKTKAAFHTLVSHVRSNLNTAIESLPRVTSVHASPSEQQVYSIPRGLGLHQATIQKLARLRKLSSLAAIMYNGKQGAQVAVSYRYLIFSATADRFASSLRYLHQHSTVPSTPPTRSQSPYLTSGQALHQPSPMPNRGQLALSSSRSINRPQSRTNSPALSVRSPRYAASFSAMLRSPKAALSAPNSAPILSNHSSNQPGLGGLGLSLPEFTLEPTEATIKAHAKPSTAVTENFLGERSWNLLDQLLTGDLLPKDVLTQTGLLRYRNVSFILLPLNPTNLRNAGNKPQLRAPLYAQTSAHSTLSNTATTPASNPSVVASSTIPTSTATGTSMAIAIDSDVPPTTMTSSLASSPTSPSQQSSTTSMPPTSTTASSPIASHVPPLELNNLGTSANSHASQTSATSQEMNLEDQSLCLFRQAVYSRIQSFRTFWTEVQMDITLAIQSSSNSMGTGPKNKAPSTMEATSPAASGSNIQPSPIPVYVPPLLRVVEASPTSQATLTTLSSSSSSALSSSTSSPFSPLDAISGDSVPKDPLLSNNTTSIPSVNTTANNNNKDGPAPISLASPVSSSASIVSASGVTPKATSISPFEALSDWEDGLSTCTDDVPLGVTGTMYLQYLGQSPLEWVQITSGGIFNPLRSFPLSLHWTIASSVAIDTILNTIQRRASQHGFLLAQVPSIARVNIQLPKSTPLSDAAPSSLLSTTNIQSAPSNRPLPHQHQAHSEHSSGLYPPGSPLPITLRETPKLSRPRSYFYASEASFVPCISAPAPVHPVDLATISPFWNPLTLPVPSLYFSQVHPQGHSQSHALPPLKPNLATHSTPEARAVRSSPLIPSPMPSAPLTLSDTPSWGAMKPPTIARTGQSFHIQYTASLAIELFLVRYLGFSADTLCHGSKHRGESCQCSSTSPSAPLPTSKSTSCTAQLVRTTHGIVTSPHASANPITSPIATTAAVTPLSAVPAAHPLEAHSVGGPMGHVSPRNTTLRSVDLDARPDIFLPSSNSGSGSSEDSAQPLHQAIVACVRDAQAMLEGSLSWHWGILSPSMRGHDWFRQYVHPSATVFVRLHEGGVAWLEGKTSPFATMASTTRSTPSMLSTLQPWLQMLEDPESFSKLKGYVSLSQGKRGLYKALEMALTSRAWDDALVRLQ